jgi:hypothetical protein
MKRGGRTGKAMALLMGLLLTVAITPEIAGATSIDFVVGDLMTSLTVQVTQIGEGEWQYDYTLSRIESTLGPSIPMSLYEIEMLSLSYGIDDTFTNYYGPLRWEAPDRIDVVDKGEAAWSVDVRFDPFYVLNETPETFSIVYGEFFTNQIITLWGHRPGNTVVPDSQIGNFENNHEMPIPEPGTLLLLGAGLAGLGVLASRKRKN